VVFSTRSGGQGDLADDAEINVTHFMPSVHLKGTRTEKLEKLDLLITHLEGLRRSIAEQQVLPSLERVVTAASSTVIS
jgi:hypothetical protein